MGAVKTNRKRKIRLSPFYEMTFAEAQIALKEATRIRKALKTESAKRKCNVF